MSIGCAVGSSDAERDRVMGLLIGMLKFRVIQKTGNFVIRLETMSFSTTLVHIVSNVKFYS
jgi:hypothetical protein